MLIELREHPHPNGVAPKRQPVCLLLGGGMAAGKSTVREIIGQDIFWSKARRLAVAPHPTSTWGRSQHVQISVQGHADGRHCGSADAREFYGGFEKHRSAWITHPASPFLKYTSSGLASGQRQGDSSRLTRGQPCCLR